MGSYSIRVIICSYIQWVVCRGLYGVFYGEYKSNGFQEKIENEMAAGIIQRFLWMV